MTEKVVLVTGAAGGIGRALCQLFAEGGWRVLATDLPGHIDFPVDHYFSLDLTRFVTDDEYRQSSVADLLREVPGGLHCLINNAAHQVVAPVEELTAEDWLTTFNVNVTAPFLLVRELLAALRRAQGSVINIASIHAHLTKPGFTAYASSKAALEGFTRALAVEIGAGVRVNGIAPAAIVTPMLEAGFEGRPGELDSLGEFHPSNCLGQPEEVARLAMYLAATESKFLNGAIVGLDGGIASRLHDPG